MSRAVGTPLAMAWTVWGEAGRLYRDWGRTGALTVTFFYSKM
jgi:hypothetical protein